MPFSDESDGLSACPPPVERRALMTFVASVEEHAGAPVAKKRSSAFHDLDMGASVRSDEDASGLAIVFTGFGIAFDRADDVFRHLDQTQSCPQNHVALGPHVGQAAEGPNVVSLAANDCTGSSIRVLSRKPGFPLFQAKTRSSASAAAAMDAETGKGA